LTFDLATARRLVLKVLASMDPSSNIAMDVLETGVGGEYGREQGQTTPGPSRDWRTCLGPNGSALVYEIIWDCIVQRILTPSRDTNAILRLTDFGTEVVREQRWSPYDPDGYLKELSAQAPTLSSHCRMYAAEALQCFRGGCYLATVVMLGAASEGIVLELFRRFVTALKAGNVPEAPSVEDKIGKQQSVYRKYEVFRKHFDSLVRPKLPSELGDDLNLQFDGVFNLIRFYRNDAGHPTGTRIEGKSALTSLGLFVPYCNRVEDLINWLEANSGTLNK
jgi:hypothetical protein